MGRTAKQNVINPTSQSTGQTKRRHPIRKIAIALGITTGVGIGLTVWGAKKSKKDLYSALQINAGLSQIAKFIDPASADSVVKGVTGVKAMQAQEAQEAQMGL